MFSEKMMGVSTHNFGLTFPKIGTKLAPLMQNAVTGKPIKDPDTVYMMGQSLSTTYVTKLTVNAY